MTTSTTSTSSTQITNTVFRMTHAEDYEGNMMHTSPNINANVYWGRLYAIVIVDISCTCPNNCGISRHVYMFHTMKHDQVFVIDDSYKNSDTVKAKLCDFPVGMFARCTNVDVPPTDGYILNIFVGIQDYGCTTVQNFVTELNRQIKLRSYFKRFKSYGKRMFSFYLKTKRSVALYVLRRLSEPCLKEQICVHADLW